MPEGLRGAWAEEFDGDQLWTRRLRSEAVRIRQFPLTILMWGPGEGWKTAYAKRRAIIDYLTERSPANVVKTSEELIAEHPELRDFEPHEAEELHWRVADVILVLIPPDKGSTGPRGEMLRYIYSPRFRERTWVIAPKLSRAERERLGFVEQGWHTFPPERQRPYTEREYRSCVAIRRYCGAVVERRRKELAFDALRKTDFSTS